MGGEKWKDEAFGGESGTPSEVFQPQGEDKPNDWKDEAFGGVENGPEMYEDDEFQGEGGGDEEEGNWVDDAFEPKS